MFWSETNSGWTEISEALSTNVKGIRNLQSEDRGRIQLSAQGDQKPGPCQRGSPGVASTHGHVSGCIFHAGLAIQLWGLQHKKDEDPLE